MTEELPFCECGKCGLRVAREGNRYITGHNRKGKKHSPETITKMSKPFLPARRKALSKRKRMPCSDTRKMAISKSHLREKNPLPDGQVIKLPSNKDCASYLGIIAERILENIYKDVKIMPYCNHGFDFYCAKKYKIDVKSSAIGYKGKWQFAINKNTIPDYFLCIAFEDRENLNPVHLWLIPGKDINHLISAYFNKSKLKNGLNTSNLLIKQFFVVIR